MDTWEENRKALARFQMGVFFNSIVTYIMDEIEKKMGKEEREICSLEHCEGSRHFEENLSFYGCHICFNLLTPRDLHKNGPTYVRLSCAECYNVCTITWRSNFDAKENFLKLKKIIDYTLRVQAHIKKKYG